MLAKHAQRAPLRKGTGLPDWRLRSATASSPNRGTEPAETDSEHNAEHRRPDQHRHIVRRNQPLRVRDTSRSSSTKWITQEKSPPSLIYEKSARAPRATTRGQRPTSQPKHPRHGTSFSRAEVSSDTNPSTVAANATTCATSGGLTAAPDDRRK